ncbi:hypothetical protein GCM10023185_17980 [Hymenobacter saemangeumensis]|uniref:DUF2383 domain-containing protein n=1 Tax=Hymenobacter saemangeumensis TaxID=1084522 RepID=A0ABP8IBT6_9BACT
MSHPNSPRVSTDSAAANALSQASDPTNPSAEATNNAALPTSGGADDTATSGGSTSGEGFTGGAGQLFSQVTSWLQDSSLQTAFTQVPEPLKRLATQTSGRWRQLSTTQKVVGGALLAAGSWYLLSRPGKGGSARSKGSQTDTLHELLLFVNDRVEGYQRAASESKEPELQGYYKQLVSQSQQFANRLNTFLREQDGSRETGTTLKGKLYRAWMETKAAVTGYDEDAILGSNVYGEEWAIKAYEEALQDPSLTGALRMEVQRQYTQSQQTYKRLQQLQARR